MTTTVAIGTETWYHLALSLDGALIFLFVNGNLAGQLTLPRGGPTSSWWGPLYLGGSKDTTGFFDGLIDEVAFYARTLTPEEIQGSYRRRLSGPCKP